MELNQKKIKKLKYFIISKKFTNEVRNINFYLVDNFINFK